jgi:hypothetical protein
LPVTGSERPFALPADGLSAFLEGAWCIKREIRDRRLGIDGSLSGSAVFLPIDGGLRYREEGTLTFGDYEGESSRELTFRTTVSPDRMAVFFPDNRHFYDLDMTCMAASAVHHCPPDIYEVETEIGDTSYWTQTWQIAGPRKNLVIRTEFSR